MINCLNRLGHYSIVGSYDDHCDVRELSASCSHGGEGGVARGVNEGDELVTGFDLVCTNMLCDAASLSSGHIRLADGVEQGRLSVVYVAKNRHDWGTFFERRRVVSCFFWLGGGPLRPERPPRLG